MEKFCEFCTVLRPLVYCEPDAAHLCLSCDAKVHSANALSSRHPRTLVCESCRCGPAYVRCTSHMMFICDDCDHSMHEGSSDHQKQAIRSYIGCPSAKDFAALWGFNLNELDISDLQGQLASADPGVVNFNIPRQFCPKVQSSGIESEVDSRTSVFGAESEVGLSSQNSEVLYKGKQTENSCHILQQILDLNRLQLTEECSNSTLIHDLAQADVSSSNHETSQNLEEKLDQHLLGLDVYDLPMSSSHQESNSEPFAFSELENLTPPSAVENPLNRDPFWQCRSPVHSGQLWSQNMQDLGVCEELGCLDDFDIPDIDLTFRNFEELFGGDDDPARALPDPRYTTCFSMDKDTIHDRSDNQYARATEDALVASSIHITRPAHMSKDLGPSNQASQK